MTIPEGATTPDPVTLDAAAAELELETPIEQAYVTPGGQLHIHTRYEAHVIPVAGRDDTLPRTASSDVRALGLDDFTAITGVGSVTAQKLHNLELYTYDDLRFWLEHGTPDAEDYEISDHTVGQIEDWLNARLV